ncbi:MAG: ABC transporter permease [Nitrospinae bacterium]|nr:ABC transporter permease [Nitrospinota bacterium]
MMSPRFIKVFRDLTTDRMKSLMLTLAVAIGVFGIGTILGAYAVLTREMAGNYLGTQPASATIKLENGSIDQNLLEGVNNIPGILQTERHATVLSRMKIGDDWYPMLLFVIDDFQNIKTNKIIKVSGAWPPPTGTMLVERTALVVMKSGEGEKVIVKTPHGEQKAVLVSGIVHDPGLAPAWQEQSGYGYITLSTLHWLGEQQGFDELRIRMDDTVNSINAIEEISKAAADWIESQGNLVHEIQIPPPGRHPHQSQMNAVLSLFIAFSFMTLILGAILVTTSISTLMLKQIREIGIMKTIGAGSFQISGLYLLMIFTFSVFAVVPAVFLSYFSSNVLIYRIATLLNLTIFDASIPHWVFAVQALSDILIPLSATAVPVLRGGRITVREAIDNYGVTKNSFGNRRLPTFNLEVQQKKKPLQVVF